MGTYIIGQMGTCDRWERTFFVNFSVRSNINMTIRVRQTVE